MTSTGAIHPPRRAPRIHLTATAGHPPDPRAVMARTDITPAAKLIYFALIRHSGLDVYLSYPGEPRLTQMTGLTISTVRRAMRQLVQAHLMATNHPNAPGQANGNPAETAPTPDLASEIVGRTVAALLAHHPPVTIPALHPCSQLPTPIQSSPMAAIQGNQPTFQGVPKPT